MNPICCLCGKECENEYGNNPYPVASEGKCCNDCNATKVIPARFAKAEEDKKAPMMKCGHSANAVFNDKPCCAICAPSPDAYEVVETPDVTGRKAKCSDCDYVRDSSVDLPFFEYRPDEEYDKFYCGCMGWE